MAQVDVDADQAGIQLAKDLWTYTWNVENNVSLDSFGADIGDWDILLLQGVSPQFRADRHLFVSCPTSCGRSAKG